MQGREEKNEGSKEMIPIPKPLQSNFFREEQIQILFAKEFHYYTQEKENWVVSEVEIEQLLYQWKEDVFPILQNLHSKREIQTVIPLMKKGISLFFSLLFWTNEKPVHLNEWEKNLDSFSFIPLNTIERLQFIMKHPNLYHSFIQLKELMSEMEKLYRKSLIMKKN